jgi:hypothetical protein
MDTEFAELRCSYSNLLQQFTSLSCGNSDFDVQLTAVCTLIQDRVHLLLHEKLTRKQVKDFTRVECGLLPHQQAIVTETLSTVLMLHQEDTFSEQATPKHDTKEDYLLTIQNLSNEIIRLRNQTPRKRTEEQLNSSTDTVQVFGP